MNKQQDSKKTIKTALLNTIANMFSLVVGMIMIPIISHVIPGEDLGIASTFLSTRNCVVIVVMLAVYAYVNKAMLEFKEEKKEYLFSISMFCIVATIVAFLVCLPFKEQVKLFLSPNDFSFYWLFVSMLSFALFSLANYYCIFHNLYKILFVIVLCTGPLGQFVSVGLSYVLPTEKYIGRIIGLDLTYFIVSIVFLVWLLLTSEKRCKKEHLTNTLSYTIPIIPHLLSQMVLTQCDLLMIKFYTGDLNAGIYSMAHTVGFLAFTVMTQIMAVWSPWVFRRLEENDFSTIKGNSNLMVILGGYVSIGLLTITTELVNIFLSDTYKPCIYIVPPLVVAMYFQFVYLFMYDLEYYHKKSKWIATASVIASILNVILNIIFIPMFGFGAACYTTVASYLILLILNYIFSVRLGANEIYNMKNIVLFSIFIVVYAAAMMLLVDYIIIRYVILVLITLGLIGTQYKNALLLLKTIRGK